MFQDWDAAREINAYPPSSGAYALYTRSKFYELFDSAADVFFRLEDNVINPIYKVRKGLSRLLEKNLVSELAKPDPS
jgi:hypothetical protein